MKAILVATLGVAVAGCQDFGFGDPGFTVYVQNDAGEDQVLLLVNDELGTSDRYLASANAVGGTVTGAGRFRGAIKVLDPSTCVTERELPIQGGAFVVVISANGAIYQVSMDDAFPDPLHQPKDQFSMTTLCGSDEPSPS